MDKIKILAEKHFFQGKKLTAKEKFILENSKYRDLVDHTKVKDLEFNKILEEVGIETETEFKPKTYKRFRMGCPGVDKRAIMELVNDIERSFNLGIDNGNPMKYDSVNLQSLKQYIQDFSNKNVFDSGTKCEIDQVLKCDDVYDVMLRLYSVR